MARKRPLRNPLPSPPPSPSPSPTSIRKEESEKGNDIAEDEDHEEQMSTDNEEDDKEEDDDDDDEEEEEDDDDDDDEEVQKVEKKPHVVVFKATAPSPSKSDSGSDSDNHFTIKPVVSKLAVPKPTKKMTEKAVPGGSDVELILGLRVNTPNGTSNSRLKTAVKTDDLKTAVKTDNLKTEVTTEEKVDEVEGSLEKYTALDGWLEMGNVPEGVKWVMRKRLRGIEKSQVRGLEERWRSLRKAELELFLQTLDFVSEQLKLVLEAESNSEEFYDSEEF